MFDYILTGPISGVSAGQYLIGLVLDTLASTSTRHADRREAPPHDLEGVGLGRSSPAPSRCTSSARTSRGIHESSDKALKIMIATTVMAVVMLVWCGVTLAVSGRRPDPERAGPVELPSRAAAD